MQGLKTRYKISISGLNLHYVLAFFEEQKFNIYDIKREDKTLFCTISKRDFLTFKKTELFNNYNISIVQKYGSSNFLSSLVKHIGILIGVCVCLISCISITNKIHSVIIVTDNHICQNKDDCILNKQNISAVNEVLKQNNIFEGASISSLPRSKEIEQVLMQKFKQISGVSITRKGVYLYVDIIENKLLNPSHQNKLIAEENGIVLSIDVTSGTQKVSPGDIVMKGDILVEDNGNSVVATAKIRSFYHETLIYNENQIKYIKTGKNHTQNNISLFGLKLKSSSRTAYKLYECKPHKRYGFVNLFLPIKIEETVFYELKKQEQIIPFKDVEQELKDALKSTTLRLIPSSATIINTTYTTHQEGSRTRLDCYIEAHITHTKT